LRKSLFAWVIFCGVAVLLLSCGRDQELVSIQIQPASVTFGSSTVPVIDNAGAQSQLQALGSYIHPPVTKDITNQVTWSSNTPQMMTVDSSGLLTVTGLACGTATVSATVTTNKSAGGISSSGAIVTGYMTGNVVCFTSSGANPVLTVSFLGNGSGTVVSSPVGLGSCNTALTLCSTNAFAAGTPIMLTATPNSGSTFGAWQGCPAPPVGNVCSFTVEADVNFVVTFN
jgi:Bacterial Ig-like domain (group 2)